MNKQLKWLAKMMHIVLQLPELLELQVIAAENRLMDKWFK